MITIPTRTDVPFFSVVANLEGSDYLLEFRYNQRSNRYAFRIGATDGVTWYVQGLVCVTGSVIAPGPLLPNAPPGFFMVVPNGADDSAPGLGELGPGARCELQYVTRGEIVSGVLVQGAG